MIDPPKRQDDYEDRLLDCEEAMETMFQAMVEAMREVGWTPRDVERAVFRLNAASRQARVELARTEAELAIIRAMERARQ